MNGVQDSFSRLVIALEPWLEQVVIIGGWAHQLYRRHLAAQELEYPPFDDARYGYSRAAQISDQRGLSPEAIREACQYGFVHVFR